MHTVVWVCLTLSYFYLLINSTWVNENQTDSRLFEGDIEGMPHYLFNTEHNMSSPLELNAAFRWNYALWPNATVPYVIDSMYFQKIEMKYIEAMMREINLTTCVKFVPRTSEKNYIMVKFNSACCSSRVGCTNQGLQYVFVNHNCMERNDILHELMHVLGFFHEHNRPDRDDYVEIHWDNIASGAKKNFKKQPHSNLTHLNTSYDFASIMHYPSDGSSKNGKPTITPKDDWIEIKADGLSETDILQIKRLYNCPTDCDNKKDGELQPGTRLHNDYKHLRINSVDACKQQCLLDRRCKAMSYLNRELYAYENCFLFNSSFWSTADDEWTTWIKNTKRIKNLRF